MIDALTFLKKRRDYCNSVTDCSLCQLSGCTANNNNDIEAQIKFIESIPIELSKCPTCGHDVKIVDGKYTTEKYKIDAQKIAEVAFSRYCNSTTRGMSQSFISSVSAAIEDALK